MPNLEKMPLQVVTYEVQVNALRVKIILFLLRKAVNHFRCNTTQKHRSVFYFLGSHELSWVSNQNATKYSFSRSHENYPNRDAEVSCCNYKRVDNVTTVGKKHYERPFLGKQ